MMHQNHKTDWYRFLVFKENTHLKVKLCSQPETSLVTMTEQICSL